MLLSTVILVSSMISRSEKLRPNHRSGPDILMNGLVQPNVGLVFSKEIGSLTSRERLCLHLSIAHPKDPAVDHDWILPKFVEILGDPGEQRDKILCWKHIPIVPGIVHHFFWEV